MELMVPVDGGELYVEDTQGHLPPVVLLHPGWGDSRIWHPTMDRLATRARVIRYDVRGYHRSPARKVPLATSVTCGRSSTTSPSRQPS